MIQESIARLADLDIPANPFPGLRPFEFYESHLFFGREDQSESLTEKLSRRHFLAIVGTSGSGKSSLVRAGLLPALIGGMMRQAGSVWRVALMRPGNDPIGNLATALNSPDAFGSADEENRSLQIAITETTLRRGNLGLIESVRQARMPSSESLLVIADQFEELFRVGQSTRPEEAENDKAAFVKLLLEASRQREMNIYVALTMRSDYLGDCAQFRDLPEAINESQYLIPRLTLDQRRAAITGPVEMGGAQITSRLVNRLMNDVGDNPDQLPILQHALMRTWDNWKVENQPDEPIDLRHYEAIGGMAEALSRHADEAYNELPDQLRKVAEKVFKALTEKGADNREIRRPILLSDLCAAVAAQASDVIAVIEPFRRPGRSFLMPPADTRLTADTLIDISHESLIRVWKRLKGWVDEESRSARQYQRLAETADLHAKGEEGLLRDPALQVALDWRKQNDPNAAWAQRYQLDASSAVEGLDGNRQPLEPEKVFNQVLQFLDDSRKQRTAFVFRRRLGIAGLILLAAVAITAAVFAFKQKKVAEEKTNEAVEKTRLVSRLLYVSDMGLAQKAFEDKDPARGYELLNDYLPALDTTKDELRDFDWYYLWRLHHDESATFSGHADVVSSVAFSPDGKRLASGSGDKTIKLWEVNTGKLLNTLEGHAAFVTSVAFSPDGKRLASGSQDKTIKLWEVNTGKLLNTIEGHAGPVYSVAFSPDGKRLASSSEDKTIKLWEVDSGTLLKTFAGHAAAVFSVAFSPDGKRLASGSGDNTIKLWEVDSGTLLKTFAGHTSLVVSVAFSPDGKRLASGSGDRTIKLWQVNTGKLLNTLEGHAKTVYSVAFSPDGKRLASGSYDKTIKLWEVDSGRLLKTFAGHATAVNSIAFSPDGKRLASGSNDTTIKLWQVNTGKRPNIFEGHTNVVFSVAFSPDGKRLASGSWDKTIKLWEVNTGKLLNTLEGYANFVTSVAFSPDGKLLASGSGDKTIKLWEVNTGKLLNTLEGHAGSVTSVVFSPDGKWLASGSNDTTIKLWEVDTGTLLNTLKGHAEAVTSVAFSPDGKRLASSSEDNTVKLWEVNTGKLLNTLEGHAAFVTSVAFSPDGKLLASGSQDNTLKLWEASTGQYLNTLPGHAFSVYSVAFSPDGKLLASGSQDNSIRLWQVSTGKLLDTLKGYVSPVTSVAFSPDGKVLASGSMDKTIRLFFAATDEEVAAERSH